ncbi:MAG: hypothetical protein WKG07_26455 [Hymenobacter sp.]
MAYGAPIPARARLLGTGGAGRAAPALRRLHLLGEGLPAAELPALGAVAIVRHAGPAFASIQSANWPQQLTLGQRFEVEGMISGSGLPG